MSKVILLFSIMSFINSLTYKIGDIMTYYFLDINKVYRNDNNNNYIRLSIADKFYIKPTDMSDNCKNIIYFQIHIEATSPEKTESLTLNAYIVIKI
jgi:hypothetical protein